MALPAVLLKAKNAISKGTKAVKTAKAVKSATSNSNDEEVKSFFQIFKIPILLGAPIFIYIFVVFILVITIPQVLYGAEYGDDASNNSGGSYTGDIAYVQWAVDIANDDTHGYSQCARTGPDYDCSSLVYYSLLNTGYTEEQLGSYPFATGAMDSILTKAGFKRHNYVESELEPGDILLVHNSMRQHTAIYVGEGQVVEASMSENGGICGASGDQTGSEILVNQDDGGWEAYYRKEG